MQWNPKVVKMIIKEREKKNVVLHNFHQHAKPTPVQGGGREGKGIGDTPPKTKALHCIFPTDNTEHRTGK